MSVPSPRISPLSPLLLIESHFKKCVFPALTCWLNLAAISLDDENDLPLKTPNNTANKWWSCHSGHKRLCKLCRTFPPPVMGARFTVFIGKLHTKSGDVETNPGPTTLNKRVWICDICYKQIHVRKKISIRCNRIEHWVHLRCAGIRQAQYTDTWTCHLHR